MWDKVTVGRHALAYEWIGKGPAANAKPAILLLNGSLFNYLQWDVPLRFGLKPQLLRHYSFIKFDYPGMGRSSLDPIVWDMETLAKQSWQFVDALGIEKLHLYGISKGTILGQYMAALQPQRVLSLAGYGWFHYDYSAMDSVVRFFTSRLREFESLSALEPTPLTWEEFDELWKKVYAFVISYRPPKIPGFFAEIAANMVRRKVYRLLQPTPLRTMHDWFAYAVRMMPDAGNMFRPLYSRFNEIPTLIQHAERDGTLPFEMAEELSRVLKKSTLIKYGRGYNHVSTMIRPKHAWKVAADYKRFLKNLT